MQTRENPYASPSASAVSPLTEEESRELDHEIALARRLTRRPALQLLTCVMGAIALAIWIGGAFTTFGIAGAQVPWLTKLAINYWYLYLTPFAIYCFAGYFGALSLLRCQNRLLARVGCTLSFVSIVTPLFPIAIPLALRALAVLRHHDVDLAFRRMELDERSNRTRAIAKLFGPASILLLMAYSTLITLTMPLVVDIVDVCFFGMGLAEMHMKVLFSVRGIAQWALLIGGTLGVYSAIQMIRGKQYAVCVIGSCAALIPFLSPCAFFGLPFGLWALVILLQKETRAAFAESDRASKQQFHPDPVNPVHPA